MWQILVKKPIEHKSVEYKSFKYFSLSKAKTGELKYSYKNVSTTFAIAANVHRLSAVLVFRVPAARRCC